MAVERLGIKENKSTDFESTWGDHRCVSLLMSWVSPKHPLQDCAGANLSGEGGTQRRSKLWLLLDTMDATWLMTTQWISTTQQCTHPSSHPISPTSTAKIYRGHLPLTWNAEVNPSNHWTTGRNKPSVHRRKHPHLKMRVFPSQADYIKPTKTWKEHENFRNNGLKWNQTKKLLVDESLLMLFL